MTVSPELAKVLGLLVAETITDMARRGELKPAQEASR